MKIVDLRLGESLMIGSEIEVFFEGHYHRQRDSAKLGIRAPRECAIDRAEVRARKQQSWALRGQRLQVYTDVSLRVGVTAHAYHLSANGRTLATGAGLLRGVYVSLQAEILGAAIALDAAPPCDIDLFCDVDLAGLMAGTLSYAALFALEVEELRRSIARHGQVTLHEVHWADGDQRYQWCHWAARERAQQGVCNCKVS